jgi:hypothetical protein
MLTLDYTHTLLKALGYHNTDLPFPESVHLTVCTAYINAGLALAYLGYPLNGGVTYLDLGCGFSLLRSLLPDNVHYIGVDKISVDTEKLMRNTVIDDMVSYLKTLDFDANFVLSTGAMLGMGLDEFREFQSLILAKAKPMFRKVLKNFGVGAFTLSTTLMLLGSVAVVISVLSVFIKVNC